MMCPCKPGFLSVYTNDANLSNEMARDVDFERAFVAGPGEVVACMPRNGRIGAICAVAILDTQYS